MALTAHDLTLVYPGQPPVLSGAALELRPGDRLAILGDNGAGKTTLGRALAGLMAPAQGTIRWDGRAWADYSRAERAGLVQFVGQNPWLQLSGRAFTLREEIAFGPENLCLPRAEIARRTDEAMELLGLTHLARRNCRHLSGGETQLLVLDEPTQGLDQPGIVAFYKLIEEVRAQTGAAVLMVSHDLHVVMSASDRVICLNGHICCEGTPRVVSSAPEYRALFGLGTKGALALYQHDHDHDHTHDHHHDHDHHHGHDHA